VLAGTTVRVTDPTTNESTVVQSNVDGIFVIPLLRATTYQVTAEKTGFKKYSRDGVQVRMQDTIELTVPMEVGATSESVTVTATTPLLDAATANIGQIVDSKRVTDLPIAMGTAYLMMRLSPAVIDTRSNQQRDVPWEPGSTVLFDMAGSGAQSSAITMDGAPNNNRDESSFAVVPGFVPTNDSIAEFKVQTITFDGSTGGTQGGVLNVSLKSGTNRLHGAVYGMVAPQAWTANSYTNNYQGLANTPNTVRKWGVSANGPVYIPHLYNGKNKTFFLYSEEGIHYANPQPGNYTVPTAAERTGDFSALLALPGVGANYQIYNPYSRVAVAGGRYQETPFPNNILPTSMLNPQAVAVMNPVTINGVKHIDYPMPLNAGTTIDGSNNYPSAASQHVFYNTELGKVDHNFTDKTRMFLRVNRYHADENLPCWLGDTSLFYCDHFDYNMEGFGWDFVHIFNSSFVMNARISDSRYIRSSDSNYAGKGVDLSALYGFPQSYNNLFQPTTNRHTPTMSLSTFSSLQGVYDGLYWKPQENRAMGLTFDKMKGIHAFKYGFEYRQYHQNQYQYNGVAEGGQFTFDSTYTKGPLDNASAAPRGQDFAAYLLGQPTSGAFQYADSYAEESTFYGGFFQDEVKATRKLTLTLSLRYEIEGPLTERYNRSVRDFNPTLAHPGNFDQLAEQAYAQNPTPEMPAINFSTLGGLEFAGVAGVPRELYHRDKNNFMPRIGYAFQLDNKTVLRGGYGIYFGPVGQPRTDVNLLTYNRTTNFIASNDNGLDFVANLSNPFPNGVLAPIGSGLGADTYLGQAPGTILSQNPKAQKYQKWQVDIQRQLPGSFVLEVGYIGSYADDLSTTRNLDYFPSQYLSRMPVRDQTLINYWTANMTNPFSSFPQMAGTNYAATVLPRADFVVNYPQFSAGGLSLQTFEGWSSYEAFNFQVNRRFTSGLTFQFDYTHSREMDATSFLHPDDINPEKVVASLDRPNHVSFSAMWELPFGKGKHLLSNSAVGNAVFGGWQLSSIYVFQSGAPLGFGDVPFTGNLKDVLSTTANGGYTQNRLEDFNVNGPGFQRSSSLGYSYHYQVLSSRWSWFRGPRQSTVDMSLQKGYRIKEKATVQVRFDMFNALNHPWLGNPNTTPSSTSFGQITSENGRDRWMQVEGKFIF
jgi:hypothetical protein